MNHEKITGKIAEQKLDKMIEESIKAGVRACSDPRMPELKAELAELIQIAYDGLSYLDIGIALQALADKERPEGADYVELFLQEANRV